MQQGECAQQRRMSARSCAAAHLSDVDRRTPGGKSTTRRGPSHAARQPQPRTTRPRCQSRARSSYTAGLSYQRRQPPMLALALETRAPAPQGLTPWQARHGSSCARAARRPVSAGTSPAGSRDTPRRQRRGRTAAVPRACEVACGAHAASCTRAGARADACSTAAQPKTVPEMNNVTAGTACVMMCYATRAWACGAWACELRVGAAAVWVQVAADRGERGVGWGAMGRAASRR